MKRDDQSARIQLLETGVLVDFQVLDTHIEASPDEENLAVRAELVFAGDDEEEPSDIADMGCIRLHLCTVSSFIRRRQAQRTVRSGLHQRR